MPTDATVWNACASVLATESKPLEVWRVAQPTGMTEDEVIAALIRETQVRPGGEATFRFPPLPRAAIVRLTQW
jgi:hypothetical protein